MHLYILIIIFKRKIVRSIAQCILSCTVYSECFFLYSLTVLYYMTYSVYCECFFYKVVQYFILS